MDPLALRIALRAPESRECLTVRQAAALGAFLETRNVSEVARRLGVSRPTAIKHLRLAGRKLLAFGRSALS